MTTYPPGSPRETYAAYLRGEISVEEAGRRATAWYAAWKESAPKQPPPQDSPR